MLEGVMPGTPSSNGDDRPAGEVALHWGENQMLQPATLLHTQAASHLELQQASSCIQGGQRPGPQGAEHAQEG